MDSSPQKNVIGATQQQPDVMAAMQGKSQMPQDFQGNVQMLGNALAKMGVTPEDAIKIGDIAQAAIKDKALYPIVVSEMVKRGIIPSSQRNGGLSYKILSQMAVIGEAAKQLVKKPGA